MQKTLLIASVAAAMIAACAGATAPSKPHDLVLSKPGAPWSFSGDSITWKSADKAWFEAHPDFALFAVQQFNGTMKYNKKKGTYSFNGSQVGESKWDSYACSSSPGRFFADTILLDSDGQHVEHVLTALEMADGTHAMTYVTALTGNVGVFLLDGETSDKINTSLGSKCGFAKAN